MFTVNVNGKDYTSEQDKKLLRFLRDDLHLTAAKDGCSEGVCGTCTVLVDGKKVKTCTMPLSKLTGKRIVTVEGIAPEEMRVYEHCFAEAGAVQCGFCIPGMIISAKSLLDGNLNPTPEDVKKAIRGNLCRCTGYKKIEEAGYSLAIGWQTVNSDISVNEAYKQADRAMYETKAKMKAESRKDLSQT